MQDNKPYRVYLDGAALKWAVKTPFGTFHWGN